MNSQSVAYDICITKMTILACTYKKAMAGKPKKAALFKVTYYNRILINKY